MGIKDECLRNPLCRLGYETDDILRSEEFGAIAARAGVGKTSLLVQLALNAMLRQRSVLHIRLNSPVQKINLWYEEIFERFAEHHHVAQQAHLWETILPYRFIMTFQVDSFSVPRLVERLRDLTEQNIFHPDLMIVDGFDFSASIRNLLSDLKNLVREKGIYAWFSVRTHRHEAPCADGLPVQLAPVADLFETVIQLQPEGPDIHVSVLKGGNAIDNKKSLRIDPSTLLLL